MARVGYLAWRGSKGVVVVDGVETEYERVGKEYLVFSPDSRRVAYMAGSSDKMSVVVDGVAGPVYDGILLGSGPTFSPDSQHLAYVGKREGKWRLVLDGSETECEEIAVNTLTFSPDGKHLAYIVDRGGKKLALVLDGVQAGVATTTPPAIRPIGDYKTS